MVTEEQKFANQGAIWQGLFDKAQSAWLAGEYELSGEHYSELRKQTTPFLLSIAGRKASSRHAEEIVAQAHVELYERMIEGEVIGNVGGLLRTIVQCRAIDAVRRASNRRERPADNEFWARYADEDGVGTDDVEDEVTRHLSALELINPILSDLHPELCRVLLARHLEDKSVEETAALLGLTVDQVRKRTAKALKLARAIAQEKGLSL